MGWALVALLFFLFFSVPPEGEEQADWYFVGITILETGAFAVASLLCFRNWRSSQIVSGRNVWLLIGLGLFSYTLGNILFYIWGNVWGKDPSVSLGDVFYLLCYIFLAIGMLQAVLPRRLHLEVSQRFIVIIIGILGIVLPTYFNYFAIAGEESLPPAQESTLPDTATSPGAVPEGLTSENDTGGTAPAIAPTADSAEESSAPTWVVNLDKSLEPYEPYVTFLYLVGDCLLLMVAATLLVAFWGGRFSQSWKLIAIAAFCLYIADMFFAYYVNVADAYQEGSLWEVFWTFSAVFFGLGAIVEYSVSSRPRRTSRRRRA